MEIIPQDLHQKLTKHDQEHVLRWWPQLSESQRESLVGQLQKIDLPLINKLVQSKKKAARIPTWETIEPITADVLDEGDRELRGLGEDALRRGEVASLVVAGGQGTRLGFDDPKGMYPIGPVSGHSLFQIYAEKILALARRFGRSLPLLVMTSTATDARTREFFAQNDHFGLPPEEVHFFCQGVMPAVDKDSGKLLMQAPDKLCFSPDGHGGVLPALVESGLLTMLEHRGVEHLFYFQVDNPLVKIADPLFLGHHIKHQADVSTKAVPKHDPEEKVGNLALVDDKRAGSRQRPENKRAGSRQRPENGRCAIIEYSDLPKELANARDDDGRLRFANGNTAIHIFDVGFLRQVSRDLSKLPFHLAKKKVPYLDEDGNLQKPKTENALKFERFIFDVLPLAQRWTVVQIAIDEEYAPLKNKNGPHSPTEVKKEMSALAEIWLRKAGADVVVEGNGEPAYLEISPLFALNAAELAVRIQNGQVVRAPAYLRPKS